MQSNGHFWNKFANVINQNVVQKLNLPVSLEVKWDGFDLLNNIGLQSQKIAEAGFVVSGLATPGGGQDANSDKATVQLPINAIQSSLPDIKKATQDLLRQTDSVLGAFMVLTAAISKLNNEECKSEESSETTKLLGSLNESVLNEKKTEEMRELFSTAESAMEAWAMLATSLGHPSFIKSEFEKICFLDNASTDTQVAIWRDSARRRLVVAFRGTEQARWKDLRTDLMLVPAGLNPERIGGDSKQEVQVHSGFLSAYDSVRIRIISIIKVAIGYTDNGAEPPLKWHVYVTGHSLGGALATLLALELSSSQLAKKLKIAGGLSTIETLYQLFLA
uniref:Fungal lipase-type domain-containing protein n=2 Tax=Rhizophora mucronata TaxID=61149 RepID=A0A2P2KCR2_RHIMU